MSGGSGRDDGQAAFHSFDSPAAPSRCAIIDLVLLIATCKACSPSADLQRFVCRRRSAASTSVRVDVLNVFGLRCRVRESKSDSRAGLLRLIRRDW